MPAKFAEFSRVLPNGTTPCFTWADVTKNEKSGCWKVGSSGTPSLRRDALGFQISLESTGDFLRLCAVEMR